MKRQRRRWFFISLLVLLSLSFGGLQIFQFPFSNEAYAAQPKTLQTGTTTISAGSASATATITAVDTTKAFLVFGVSENTNRPGDGQVSGQITDSSTLTFTRIQTTGVVTVKWYVAEFISGVSVRRGTADLTLGIPSNQSLNPAVNTAKSFPIISYRVTGSDFDNNDFVRAEITSSTNLQLNVPVCCPPDPARVEWQVVEYTDSIVKSGNVSFGVGDLSKTATLSPSVNTAKSWLIYTYQSDDGTLANIGQKLVRGLITDATTLTFDRNNTGQAIVLTWYLVEFTDGTTVQNGSASFTAMKTGSYPGTGVAQPITGLGFSPDAVIVKAGATQIGVIRSSTMPTGDNSKPMTGATALSTLRIQSLDVDGFSVGTNAQVNTSPNTYYWMAFKANANMKVGTYTGTGGSQSITGMGFSPEYVILAPANTERAVHRSIWNTDDNSYRFNNAAPDANKITSLDGDGFTVGSAASTSSIVYHYVAWNEVPGQVKVGSYTGDDVDLRTISGVGFQPEYVIVKNYSAANTWPPFQRSASMPAGDSSIYFQALSFITDRIETLIADGFQVGTQPEVNVSGSNYFYAAFTGTRKDITISPVNVGSSIAAAGYFMRGGSSPYTGDDNPGVAWFTLDLTSSTNLRITRGVGFPTADVGWFVIQFEGAPFQYRSPITINQLTGVCDTDTENLLDFPVLISLSGDWLKTRANDPANGHIENANGYDIIFRASDGVTQLDHEIEKYDGSTGALIAWVKVPTLYYNQNATIYMYYGNGTIASPTQNPTGVWGNYVGVWHLSESSGSGYYLRNSKQDNYHADAGSTLYLSNSKIDGGRDLNGDYCDVQNGDQLFNGDSTFTLEFWAYPDYVDDAAWAADGEASFLMSNSLWLCRWFKGSAPLNTGEIQCDVEWSDSSTNWFNNSGYLTRAQWNHIVLTYDGTNLRWYINGSQVQISNDAGRTLRTNSYLSFGDATETRLMNSNFDEFRYSRTARSRCWIWTEYNNQSAPGSFYSLGGEGPAAPTAVKLTSFAATEHSGGVLLRWKTGYEVDNLGFHIYREENGQLVRLTPEPVAGSALLAGSRTALGAGHHYHWWDASAIADVQGPLTLKDRPLASRTVPQVAGLEDRKSFASSVALLERSAPQAERSAIHYWLKDIDLNGTHKMHGPVTPILSREPLPEKFRPELLSEVGLRLQEKYHHYWKVQELKDRLGNKRSAMGHRPSAVRRASNLKAEGRSSNLQRLRPGPRGNSVPDPQTQQFLAGKSAVKLLVKEEGWYRVSRSELVAAGLSSELDPRYLQLFAEGREQPIRIIGKRDGVFGPRDAIEFYGVGLDTPSTDKRVYWLSEGLRPGKRVEEHRSQGGQISSASFLYTIERKDRVIYFPNLRNGDEENWFGPIVSSVPVDQLLNVQHLDPAPSEDALLEVSIQGGTEGTHRVKVYLNDNDNEVGELVFEGQAKGLLQVEVPQAILQEGENLVSLVAQNGETDISVIDSIRLTYWHTYTADNNGLRFTAQGGNHLTVNGFSNSRIRVFDITDSRDLIEVIGKVRSEGKGYAITFRVPEIGSRTFLALTEEGVKSTEGVVSNRPSSWHEGRNGADLVIIAYRDFVGSLQPLKTLRESQGLKVALIDIEDLYDEFSFGARSPKAIKDFLSLAKAKWHKPPRFVLLVGDASFDPKNYYGYGDFDFVPTKLIDTVYMETASDDWFVDFNNDGLPEMAIGRLPVRTVEEANTVVSKIIGYEKTGAIREALLVADMNEKDDEFSFEGASEEIRSLLPSSLMVRKIYRGQFSSDSDARRVLLGSINEGPLLVNFIGHGSLEIWRGSILTSDDAENLTNRGLPFFVSMTCLNGSFQDPYAEPLGEALLKAPQGGAIAVWTSSGLTEPDKQAVMNKELIRLLFNGQSLTLGEATAKAKKVISDQDIRKTWILFGDPTTRLRQ